jgi:hypothetical protein
MHAWLHINYLLLFSDLSKKFNKTSQHQNEYEACSAFLGMFHADERADKHGDDTRPSFVTIRSEISKEKYTFFKLY